MVKPTRPVDIYTRASRAGEGSTTHEQQEAEARAFAASQGLRVGKVLRDLTKSTSATLDRPVLQEALRRVRSGKSGGVVVAYLSRSSRDTRQGLELLETITNAGGAVYAPNLPDYTTADGLMLTTIQFAIDTGYRDRKGEELEKRKRESIEAGIPVNTRPAVGLRKRRDKRLERHPRTGPIVRDAFERRARGEGPAALGAFLESKGVKTSQGSRTWSKQAVYGLIENPIYKGLLRYGKDDRYTNPDGVVGGPLVDPATWEAAQHPNGRSLHAARSDESSWLVAGVLRCNACRYSMQGTTTSRGKRIYRCNRRHAGGRLPRPGTNRRRHDRGSRGRGVLEADRRRRGDRRCRHDRRTRRARASSRAGTAASRATVQRRRPGRARRQLPGHVPAAAGRTRRGARRARSSPRRRVP